MEPQGCRQNHPPTAPLGQAAAEDRNWDSRYRSIIGHLEHMLELLRLQPGRDLRDELDQLLAATMSQIGPEESSMELVKFPGAGQHRVCHQFICINTAKLRYRLLKGVRVLPEELEYLRMLWLEHLEAYDRVFEEFLAS